jgi:hypothetical protein
MLMLESQASTIDEIEGCQALHPTSLEPDTRIEDKSRSG